MGACACVCVRVCMCVYVYLAALNSSSSLEETFALYRDRQHLVCMCVCMCACVCMCVCVCVCACVYDDPSVYIWHETYEPNVSAPGGCIQLSLEIAWGCCTEIFLECVSPRLGLLYRDLLRDRLGITVALVFVFGKCVAPRDVREEDPA